MAEGKDQPKKKLSERSKEEDKKIRSEAGRKAAETRKENYKKRHEGDSA